MLAVGQHTIFTENVKKQYIFSTFAKYILINTVRPTDDVNLLQLRYVFQVAAALYPTSQIEVHFILSHWVCFSRQLVDSKSVVRFLNLQNAITLSPRNNANSIERYKWIDANGERNIRIYIFPFMLMHNVQTKTRTCTWSVIFPRPTHSDIFCEKRFGISFCEI